MVSGKIGFMIAYEGKEEIGSTSHVERGKKRKRKTHLPSELDGKVHRDLHAALVVLLVRLGLVSDDTAERLDFLLRDGDELALELVGDLELLEVLALASVERPEVPVVLLTGKMEMEENGQPCSFSTRNIGKRTCLILEFLSSVISWMGA
jgi:hypothetical protein